AGGKNSDIMAVFKNAIPREPGSCSIICLREDSPLSTLGEAYGFVDLVKLNLPWTKDGFLSTNSLLVFAVVLSRAYALAFGTDEVLPLSVNDLTQPTQTLDVIVSNLRAETAQLWGKETLLVLYGPSLRSAALDLESKFAEAALGNVQLTDFRNFAHGRHNWVAKRPSQTAILALFSDEEEHLAQTTLRLIPDGIPIGRIRIPGMGTRAAIAGMIAVLHFVGIAGEAVNLDPGRPTVPLFGRRIYNLRGLDYAGRRDIPLRPEAVSIARKTGSDVRSVQSRTDYSFWLEAYRRFRSRLELAKFGGIIFDYDGTLCGEHDRHTGLTDSMFRNVAAVLDNGIIVGIATGRGSSVRDDLRRGLSQHLWKRVYIAYHNGGQIGRLCDDSLPNAQKASYPILDEVALLLGAHPVLAKMAVSRQTPTQISVRPLSHACAEAVFRIVSQVVALSPDATILRSGHSTDILPRRVSKSLLVDHLASLTGGAKMLSIADKGQWPGNDFDLLATPYSLSVDEVSGDPDTCWNLAPAGHRGVQAALDYLACLSIDEGSFRMNLEQLGAR
ncbi:MAG: sucrose-6-phosphate hydrolase, partial [Chloroflexi bacterium]|nr:sucrose-6-phosphate hydrolase [Chloroflexota bacterium]